MKRQSVQVKICGITSIADALVASKAGADAIGLVFYRPSPRCVSVSQASDIAYSLGPFMTVVGLFVDAERSFINQVLEQVPLHLLQFHGDETAAFCEQFNRPYIKAIRMREGIDPDLVIAEHPKALGILLDAYQEGTPGGTGKTFDWQWAPGDCSKPIVLAGGLNPDNVARAIVQTRPYGVDVSGGVELSPGVKDPQKVTQFIANAKGWA